MSGTLVDKPLGGHTGPGSLVTDPRAERARPQLAIFLPLAFQLALLAGVMHLYRVGQYGGADMSFPYLLDTAFLLFCIHYWLPYGWKEWFWVSASVLAAFVWLDWRVATCLLAAGVSFFAVIRSSLAYWTRVAIVAAGFAVASALALNPERGNELIRLVSPVGVPRSVYMMFGSIFVLRMVVYLHDLRHLKERPSFRAYLAYFFILPNYIFPLMPVVDYATMRAGYYRRDFQKIAQEGVQWICRGIIQLILYQIVFYLREVRSANGTDSFGAVASFIVLSFLLYVRVSGQFHIAVGLLHLFGYDLPETYRKYLLSASLTDWWRRVNIYWKDFMVKIVYFPVFFRLRKGGQLRAKLLGTVAVFLMTWALHSYQYLWIRGTFLFTPVDLAFWSIFGILMTANILWEHRQESRGERSIPTGFALVLSRLATISLIVVLWSLWESPTFGDWFDLIAWWRKS